MKKAQRLTIASMTSKCPKESQEGMALSKYLKGRGVLFLKTTSEGSRTLTFASSLKAQGWVKGYPDYLFPENRRGYNGLAIELKRIHEKLSKTSPEQIWWLEQLKTRGWYSTVSYGAEEAKKIVDWYFADVWPANNVWHTWPNDFYNDAVGF